MTLKGSEDGAEEGLAVVVVASVAEVFAPSLELREREGAEGFAGGD